MNLEIEFVGYDRSDNKAYINVIVNGEHKGLKFTDAPLYYWKGRNSIFEPSGIIFESKCEGIEEIKEYEYDDDYWDDVQEVLDWMWDKTDSPEFEKIKAEIEAKEDEEQEAFMLRAESKGLKYIRTAEEGHCDVCGKEMEWSPDFSNAVFSKGGTMISDFDDCLDNGRYICEFECEEIKEWFYESENRRL